MFNDFAMAVILVIIPCIAAWAIAIEHNKGSKIE
jgi:hypothetical protein